MKSTRWQQVAVVLLVFSPAIVTGMFVWLNAVNIPVWDDWERGVLLRKYYEQEPDFYSYLAAPHIDHRMLVPRVLIIAMNELTGGDLIWEIALSFALYTGGAIGLFLVVRKTLGDTPWMALTAFLVNVALFSPVQYQNFLWAIQIAMLLPFACLGLMMWVFCTRWKTGLKFAVVVTLAWIGTYSFGHGLLLWPVALMMGLLLPQIGPWKKRLAFAAGVGLVGGATIAAYFLWNFKNVTVHAYGQQPGETPPGLVNFAAKPGELWDFVIGCMGNASARLFPDMLEGAPVMGKLTLILLSGVVIAWVALWWNRRRPVEMVGRVLPWLAVAAYAVATMIAMALGRSLHGWEKSVMSRYSGPSVLLAAALIVLFSTLLLFWRNNLAEERKHERWNRAALVLALIWLGAQVPTWSHSLYKMQQWKWARLQERAALLFIDHFTPKKVSRIDHTLEFAVEQARYLNGKRLLSPSLFERPDFGSFERAEKSLRSSRAQVSNASVTGAGLWLSGYATLQDPERIADGVLIAWRRKEEKNEEWTVAEMAEMETIFFQPNMSYDNIFGGARNFSRPRYHASWLESLPLERLPGGEALELSFWAMDTDRMRLYRFGPEVLEFDPDELKPGKSLIESE